MIRGDEVLVRIAAAGVDMGTWHCMTGLPYAMRLAGFGARKPKASNPGRSFAGTVESVGSDVTDVHPRDDVTVRATDRSQSRQRSSSECSPSCLLLLRDVLARHAVANVVSPLGVDAVVQHEEGDAEHPERVLGPQLVVGNVHVELLGEAVHRQGRQFP